ncbi:MAG: aminotransferase class V-fold PLP-dependent enzyme, partial [Chloroflexi bacterium]|nr:aminotransferase class V-fold PLP-dependent enzyme [Chloroflexota bacterium]
GETVLGGVNGYFGNRISEMASRYGARVVRVEAEWGRALAPEQFEAALKRESNIRLVAVVHAETSTGVLQPLEELAVLWRQQGRREASDGPTAAVRHRLAEAAIEIEVCRMLAYRIGWLQSIGETPSFEASEVKIFGSEMTQRFAHIAGQMLGLYAQLDRQSRPQRYVQAEGRVEALIRQNPMFSLVGGANEIQRNIIATRGLGLPRA